jgi:hypothetical protein
MNYCLGILGMSALLWSRPAVQMELFVQAASPKNEAGGLANSTAGQDPVRLYNAGKALAAMKPANRSYVPHRFFGFFRIVLFDDNRHCPFEIKDCD